MSLWPRRRVYVDDLPQTHDLRFAALFGGGLLLLLAGLYGVGYFVAGDRVPAGTIVSGVDIGNMTTSKARATLVDELAPRLDDPISLMNLGEDLQLDPRRAGLTFDVDETVERGLGGSSWDPRHMVRVLLGGDALDPAIAVDQEALDSELERLAQRFDRRPKETSVAFASGAPTITVGHPGLRLDISAGRERLISAFKRGDGSARLPLDPLLPTVSATQGYSFLVKVARPAVSAPVTIQVAGSRLRLSPRLFAPALATTATSKGLGLTVDAAKLMARSADQLAALQRAPVNARLRFVDGQPTVVPGKAGVTVSAQNLADAVFRALRQSGSTRRALAPSSVQPPRLTTGQLRSLRIRQRVAYAQVPFLATEAASVRKQVQKLDGTLLRPGETFSFARQVGYSGGPGAAAVVPSATYDAVFSAGMTITERTANPVYDDRYQPGLDAYVGVSADLAFRNDTPDGVYLRVQATAGFEGGALFVEVWSSPHGQITTTTRGPYNVQAAGVQLAAWPGCVSRSGVDGFEVDVTRVLSRRGETQRRVFHSAYRPQAALVCAP
ncbi:MAG: VanW family protein [Nocardioidaceae bacterium]